MLKNKFLQIFMMGMVVISFPSCNGILGNIYDNPPESAKSPYGFIEVNEETKSGRIYINASSYTDWVYVDLEGKQVATYPIILKDSTQSNQPEAWDFAMHRYDAKTNDGAVIQTSHRSLDAFRKTTALPEGKWVTDVQDSVIYDRSDMMNGNIVYAEASVNVELTKWLDVDTSEMPPIYTPSNKVYLLKTKDGKYAALYYFNYMDKLNQKGYLTIDYIYPLDF